MKKLEVGVIGLGILGSQHAQFLQAQPELEVVAVADVIDARAQAIGTQVAAQPYTDYTEMLRERTLDIVVVATPDPMHKEPVLAALRAGVPTIIQEKPLATTVADAEEMLEAAEKTQARILINFSNRGSAFDRATYYVIRQGLLGEMVYGEIHLDDNISVPTQMWGARTREWAAGSSTAHFLLSHVVDLLHWILAPAQVTKVYAISQQKVLGYTPDLYDAFLWFDNDVKFRIKAEWTKHIDTLVEFEMSFSGSKGSLTYRKRPGFGAVEGWRANMSQEITQQALLSHQEKLLDQGINVRALFHRPNPTAGELKAGGGTMKLGLEAFDLPQDWWRIERGFVDAILENTLTPSSWTQYGPLPSGSDGLRQTRVVCAIVESAQSGQVIHLTT
ncbi:MAG: Gfo/Idh/MocA family oxidoreductase [Anaerolineae bacterium]|nr:Gfo/Idh/MocA family oxidoreductase [Anaerolineae bacterium]